MTDPLWPWVEANPTLLALVTFVAGLMISGVAARFGSVSMKEVLEQRESWPKLIADYRSGPAEAYFTAIDRSLAMASRIWGPRPLSGQAFARCLQIAYLYLLVDLLLGWLLFDLREVGGLPLFPETAGPWNRLWAAAAILFGLSIVGWILLKSPKGPGDVPSPKKGEPKSAMDKSGAFVVSIAAMIALAFAISVAVPFAFHIVLSLAKRGIFADAVVVAALLFLILPFLNALADMASLAITRGFLGNVAHRRPSLWRVLGQLVLDLILAALCLALLVAGIVAALELAGWLTPYPLTFSWRGYWAAMQAAPS